MIWVLETLEGNEDRRKVQVKRVHIYLFQLVAFEVVGVEEGTWVGMLDRL